jgi:glycosyltransferase involved in cell wall biosynthesis
MPKNVLFFYPPNKRSVVIETICKTIRDAGHQIILLSFSSHGALQEALEKTGIPTYTHVIPRKPSWKFLWRQTRYLIRFCKKNKIDIVWSHLGEANFIALCASRFIKVKVITSRHHAESRFYSEFGKELGIRRNRKEVFMDKLINRMARKIIVPSSDVWRSMKDFEKCNMKKVRLVPYIYDFSSYQKPDLSAVKQIREKYPCQLLLLMVSRMVTSKQHRPVFETVSKLLQEGLSIRLLVMDEGHLKEALEEFVVQHHLQDKIIFTGFREDFINYMAAADLLMHPSLTEASSNVVKEMGLLEKAVAVCKGVGDFDDYIVHGKNGFILDPADLSSSIENVIREAYDHPVKLQEFGQSLHTDVLNYFSDTPANRKPYLELLD